MTMTYISILGLLLTICAWFVLAQIIANRRGLAIGLSIFVLPPLAIYFTARYWNPARRALALGLCGVVITGASFAFGGWSSSLSLLQANGFEKEANFLSQAVEQSYFYLYGYRSQNSAALEASPSTSENATQEAAQNQKSLPKTLQNSDAQNLSTKLPANTAANPSYASKNPESAQKFLGHQVKIKLSNGVEREAILVSNHKGALTLKERTASGYFAYEIPVKEISAFYVKIDSRISA